MKRCGIYSLLFLLMVISISCSVQQYDETAIFVSPNGNNAWSGRRAEPNNAKTDGPFATLERARDAIRDMKSAHNLPKGGVTVWVRGGSYSRDFTFELDERDSGTEERPIVYRSYKGGEVRLIGGREVAVKAFTSITDPAVLQRINPDARGKIYQVDLKKEGITDYGEMKPRGYTQPLRPVAMQLFFNDERMQLARWPNDGYSIYGELTDPGSTPRYSGIDRSGDLPLKFAIPNPDYDKSLDKPATFQYVGNHPSRWAGLDDVWLYGKWRWEWADEIIKVAAIDTVKKEISLATPHHYGIRKNKPFYALNILEEIDSPGEYYIDHKAGILYFWPPSPIEEGRAVVSMLDEPMIAIEGASYITIQGMILEASRGLGVYMTGGGHNKIAGCTLRNLGTAGVCIGEGENGRDIGYRYCVFSRLYLDSAWNRNGGVDNGVIGCDIYNTGGQGIILGGGDRKTLTPAGNYAVNNHIHDFARLHNLYHAGIDVDGVGNRVAHNKIHHGIHSAILYLGNDHMFEFNEIHHVVNSCGDAGAIYSGRDPSFRGIVFRNNFFHHIGEGGEPLDLDLGAWSIQLDFGHCGHRIEGNVFYRGGVGGKNRAPQTIQITGGHDNVITNNIFVDCPPEISLDHHRDNDEWFEYIYAPLTQRRLVESVDVTRPPYITRYPELADLFDESAPRQNYFSNNYQTTKGDPDFVDGDHLDFTLKEDADVFREIPDFKNIPFEKIGLYQDEYRTTVPDEKY